MGFIDERQMELVVARHGKSDYASYLRRVLKEGA